MKGAEAPTVSVPVDGQPLGGLTTPPGTDTVNVVCSGTTLLAMFLAMVPTKGTMNIDAHPATTTPAITHGETAVLVLAAAMVVVSKFTSVLAVVMMSPVRGGFFPLTIVIPPFGGFLHTLRACVFYFSRAAPHLGQLLKTFLLVSTARHCSARLRPTPIRARTRAASVLSLISLISSTDRSACPLKDR